MDLVRKVAFELFESVNTPRSLACYMLLRYDEYDQLVQLSCKPSNYESASSFFDDNACTEFLRKCADLPTSFDRRAVALSAALDAESQCRTTNDLFRLRSEGLFQFPQAVERVLIRARSLIASIIGQCPDLDSLDYRFGPGSTSANRGSSITIMDKISSVPELTLGARRHLKTLRFYESWVRSLPSTSNSLLGTVRPVKLVRGNRFITVPKDATKDRGICIEPSFNIAVQKAIGNILSARLTAAGLDIPTQQDRNRDLARLASISGSHSTVDLSSASDTISYLLVLDLLPIDWFDLLDSVRSPETDFGDGFTEVEKFSSMGNGYTFELETLIFWCLARACAQEVGSFDTVYAYGDDIIIPTSATSLLETCLASLGFTVNPRKTFTSGPFRESCGGDYYRGINVRAYYVKETPKDPQGWFSMANGLFQLGLTNGYFDVRDPRFVRPWRRCLDNIPANLRRVYGPLSLGDLVIHHEDWRSVVRYTRGPFMVGDRTIHPSYIRGSIVRSTSMGHSRMASVRALIPIPYRRSLSRYDPDTQLASAVYGVPSSGAPLRDAVVGYRIRWVSVG